jgi:hypothetical protein
MAATILGITTLTFGAPTVTGISVNSSSFTESVNETNVIDEDGDYVGGALHGHRVTGKISGTTNGETLATAATLAVTGAPTGTYYITEVTRSRSADGFSQTEATVKTMVS